MEKVIPFKSRKDIGESIAKDYFDEMDKWYNSLIEYLGKLEQEFFISERRRAFKVFKQLTK